MTTDFQTPDLQTIVNRMDADTDSLMDFPTPVRRKSSTVINRVAGGGIQGVYLHQEWIARQIHPKTADREWLLRHGKSLGLSIRLAIAAKGPAEFTGEEGAVIPAGTAMTCNDIEFISTTEALLVGGVASLQVVAVEPGVSANLAAGAALALVAPVPGIQPDGLVGAEGITGGEEEEDIESFRKRVEYRRANPPKGGNNEDYTDWATNQENHGVAVTRAWAYRHEMGVGSVTVRFMTDGSTSNGIPDVAAVASVQAYIDALKPWLADVYVVAPIAAPLTVRISGLDPLTEAVKKAVNDELLDLIRREAEPGGTILLSHIREAVSVATGENDHVIESPTENVQHPTGHICTFAGVEWI